MPLFIASVFLTLSATSYAASPGGGLHGASFRSGFVAHSAGSAFRMGSGIRRNFAFRPDFAFHQNRRFFHRDHRVFFQQFAWPVYWYPYYPYDYSYLDYGPDNDYQYWDNSAASVQPESFRPAGDRGPVVVVINTGNSRPMDSRADTAYINSGYSSTDAAGQQRIVLQDPNERIGPGADPRTFVPPSVPQPTQTAAKGAQTKPQAQAGIFGNLVLVSWLEDAGKDEIYVQNTETNDVQKITAEPNLDNFRIVELHPNADLTLFEAVISNGSQQGPVRFRF
ncbi:MAG TPA: hypothetical protein VFO40_14110 [Chthoniobacterales bacterium]|nr:hypothetical protein [Chthoniobacterales bacterium]